ncbi:chemotaxis protein CheA [Azospirillum soli]|uniref:chemotaxis protein CheA n=1 Tax=Azospirillum soli TaxID=1304799 RepID=UPI001AEA75EF|nr:chemotaxis protein CheA [Azospirillum soli]MBP2315637.1 two-component system chemotaxis sensor kinase CheA [Azospirillum soli]
MNPLFEQFVIEARELLDAAGAALLRLEREPGDAGAINDLFRALHTLKGATGLFDMAPFTRLVHAGEDALMAVREGRAAVTPELADRLFQLLDLGVRWVDHLDAEGDLPDGADAVARERETLLRAALGGEKAVEAPSGAFSWVDELTEAERRTAGGRTVTAVMYDPHPDCFFTGDDPLDLCRKIPDLLLLRIEPVEPWPELSALDPYRCALRFRTLSAAPKDDVARVFRSVPDQVRIATMTVAGAVTAPEPVVEGLAESILREQARILALEGTAAEREARRAVVLRTVRNILTAQGREADRAALDRVAETPEALRGFVEGLADARTGGGAASVPFAVPAAAPARRALRVEAERMDRLMSLVGELVVAKSRLPYLAREAREGQSFEMLAQGLKETQGQIDAIVGELQAAVLRLRVLPLSRVFEPLPRLVRDAARRLGKSVELRLSGEETQADKDILDVLGEPLLHLVRNSLDHGIETPDARRAAGKPETAEIRVSAFQDKNGVVVEVADDGAGIDAGAVRRKAVERGLIEADRAAALTEEEAVRLVFLPGLSTSSGVSDLSGRGVGMDAVRAAVEQAGGRVEIASQRGHGTRVRLVLPLTMMITRVMMVETAGALYGFPVTLVTGMLRVRRGDIRAVKRAESIVLHDAVVPLLRLRRLLGLPEDDRAVGTEAVLVVDLGGQTVGLVVDGFRERADVVLKPMTGVLARLRGYAGTAVLGDGQLLLVLNLRELL